MAKAIFATEQQIFLVIPEAGTPANPKREGSASFPIFNLYFKSRTVGEFLAAGGRRADILWDLEHGYILLDDEIAQPTAAQTKQVAAPKEKAAKAAPATKPQTTVVKAGRKITKAAPAAKIAPAARKPASAFAAQVQALHNAG